MSTSPNSVITTLVFCCRQQQLQSSSDISQSVPTPTLQLDLTQQPDTRQWHGAQNHQWNPSSNPSGSLLRAHHPAELDPAVVLASKASQLACIDHPADGGEHSLAGPTMYQESPSSFQGRLHADPMQHRALSGFLTPLGKLAGMFGWTPGKPNRPSDTAQMSQAAAALDHVHPGRKQLASLARPANTSAVSQEVSASLLQVKPQQLTMQQLQDLQKAADLLSPRTMLGIRGMEHSPSHAIVSSSACHADAPAVATAASITPLDASGVAAGECVQQNMPQQPRDLTWHHLSATSDSRLPSQPTAGPTGSPDAGLDSSSTAAKMAAQIGCESNVTSMTQDDDDTLAAALASRLAMMAPHISSLYGKVRTVDAFHANNSRQQDKDHTLKRTRSEEVHLEQQGLMQITGIDHPKQAKIAQVAGRHNHDVRHVLHRSSFHHDAHARKRFCRPTGLEVLQRCMPSLWQNRKELHQ